MIETVYHKALSLLSFFQNYNLKSISSQSDFCIKDFVMNKTKSLYITLSSSDLEIYGTYIKMIISIFITKIKKYYSQNIFNKNSVLFLIEDFQNTISNPLYIHYHNKKYIPNRNIDLKNKIKLPVIHSRTYLLKECKKTLKPDTRKKMWYDIPEDLYMQHEDVILEPLFTSRIPDDDKLEKISDIITDSNNYDDDEIKRLFKPTDSSYSVSKDPDYEKNKNNIEIIYHREIVKKDMYYTPKNEKEINELLKIFSHEQFDKLMKQFKQKSQRQGFICILAGSAGVGKTETVLQIARICQRNIVKYDATQISSGYIGVAACKVKDIFESYNKVVKNSKTYPILFLNEADSFFSRRIDLSCTFNQVSSLDENRTQTILLESLENFQGIMIATTNIISNFDHAFERRFLYKIIFDKPDRNTRVKILKNMLPQLNEDELQYITVNYDLTGAQIENISRKLDIKKIIKNDTSFDDVKDLCKEETDNCFTVVNKSIGFKCL